MNNGKAVYITPEHYMGLQWNQMADTGGYKEFAWHKPICIIFAKAVLLIKEVLNVFTSTARWHFNVRNYLQQPKNQKIGITSKSDTDAMVVFQKIFV
jgi:hypothetical protein